MLLMMAEVLHLASVAKAFPDDGLWSWLAFHQTHVPWVGCSIHDLIQPSFTFLVGVALPFSIASRRRRGQTTLGMIGHAVWRAIILVLLGVLLRSVGREMTYWTFEDTLSQIGLGYLPLFLVALGPRWLAWVSLVFLLVGYWAAFVIDPLPADDLYHSEVSRELIAIPNNDTFAAHFNHPGNLAQDFDRWLLNQFPREEPWTGHRGGYATLSFIPTLGTMLLGLIAGCWLRVDGGRWKRPTVQKILRLTGLGLACIVLGWGADITEVCPVVKRVWTPAWTLYSGGWCLLILGGFYLVCDAVGFAIWAWPLRVIGANSIVAYVIAHLWEDFFASTFRTHLGQDFFEQFGAGYATLAEGAAVLLCFWLVLLWMYLRGIFIKV